MGLVPVKLKPAPVRAANLPKQQRTIDCLSHGQHGDGDVFLRHATDIAPCDDLCLLGCEPGKRVAKTFPSRSAAMAYGGRLVSASRILPGRSEFVHDTEPDRLVAATTLVVTCYLCPDLRYVVHQYYCAQTMD